MDLQTLAAIIGILSGMVTLVGGVTGAILRLREPGQAPRVPVPISSYSYPPPTSNASGPNPQPGGGAVPPGYGWPNSPQRGSAQSGYPQAPQPGAPAPRPNYGAPPGQWGYVPQPARPYPTPQQNPYAQYAPWQPKRRRWFPYPWIAIGAAVFVTLAGIYSGLNGGQGHDSPSAVAVEIVSFIFYIPTVVFAARQAIKIQRWGWLVSIILIAGYGMLAFGTFGPTTPSQPRNSPRRV